MNNFITEFRVENFKSVRELSLPAKRINLFLGKPNVGKSNLLEALGVFSLPYFFQPRNVMEEDGAAYRLDEIIRAETPYDLMYNKELFHDEQTGNYTGMALRTNWSGERDAYVAVMQIKPNQDQTYLGLNALIPELAELPPELKDTQRVENDWYRFCRLTIDRQAGFTFDFAPLHYPPVKFYKYRELYSYDLSAHYFLQPPYGANLLQTLLHNRDLQKEVAPLFTQYGLNLTLRKGEDKLEIQKNEDGIVTAYPSRLISDTLMRIVFYLAAIRSNRDSVLVFEEPEVHAFPAYVQWLGQAIVADTENQYFLSTHNPYLLDALLTGAPEAEIQANIVHYQDYETKVAPLPQGELQKLAKGGKDPFFALDELAKEFSGGSDPAAGLL